MVCGCSLFPTRYMSKMDDKYVKNVSNIPLVKLDAFIEFIRQKKDKFLYLHPTKMNKKNHLPGGNIEMERIFAGSLKGCASLPACFAK